MSELFTDRDIIDPEILEAVKDMKRNGFQVKDIQTLFCHRLRITGRGEYVPYLKKQIEMIRKVV